jgi:1-phosphofructokinase family hexose kinase
MILCLCPNPSIDKFVWIEEFKPGKVNRITKEQFFPGGKGVHVALGIAELGEACTILGFWGGHTGGYIRDYCENKGISCYGPVIDEPNRTCLTFRSNGDLNDTELLEHGPLIDEEKIYLFWLEFTRLLDTTTAVCMSGSWPLTKAEIGYMEFIVAAKKKGIRTFVDCSGKSLVNVLTANPYCIHINNHEGFEVFHEHSPLKIANAVLKRCDLAAITCGADGLYLAGKNHSPIHANCKLDSIISAVGSGDSLMAGLAVAHERNLNLTETAKLSVACGAANCIREELGMFYKKDVDRLLTQTELTPVDYEFSF